MGKFLVTIVVGVMAGVVSYPVLRVVTNWPSTAGFFAIVVAIAAMVVVAWAYALSSIDEASQAPPAATAGVVVGSLVAGAAMVAVENLVSESDVGDAVVDLGAAAVGGLFDLFSDD